MSPDGRRSDRLKPRIWRGIGGALVVVYAIRCGYGLRAGWARANLGSPAGLAEATRSLSQLSTAAVGGDRIDMLWLRGEVELGVVDELVRAQRPEEEARRALDDAAGSYLEAASRCPATGWAWSSLAGVYTRVERADRDRRGVALSRLRESPWSRVGRAGRVAVGLVRKAIEGEPTTSAHRDDLVLALHELGLRDEAMAAVREAARVQPILLFHRGLDFRTLPREYLEAFAAASREVVGRTAFVQAGSHYVSLGRMELMLGRPERAAADFAAAIREPVDSLTGAEAAYHLGLALMEAGRLDEAEKRLEPLAREGVFRLQVADLLGQIAEKKGNLGEALDRFEEARRLDPVNAVWRSIEVARVASKMGEHGRAEATLKWALLRQPEATAARAALVRTYLAAGERREAEEAWEALRKASGETPEVLQLRAEILAPPSGEPKGGQGP
jgi:tetratricopeptide (TPR) repeat protein